MQRRTDALLLNAAGVSWSCVAMLLVVAPLRLGAGP